MNDESRNDSPQGAPQRAHPEGAASGGNDDPPRAILVRRKRVHVSAVWIIPVLAAVVALGIAVQHILEEGPTITIEFSAAQGIDAAGKTPLKYKDVTIGQVTSVDLTQDHSKVLVKARIKKIDADLMVNDTEFWVVSPHIGLTGISGLSTLLSGNYIGVQPGSSNDSRRHFMGLDEPPPITDQKGSRFLLRADDLGSLEIGSPIYYKSQPVGEVERYSLTAHGRSFRITAFIKSPYDQYVYAETRFWNASGLDVSLGKDGSILDVRMASLAALLAGGLSFDTPDYARETEVAPDTIFTIYPTRAVAMKQPPAHTRHFVLSFNQPVQGLSVGAPVTLMGLVVGEVTHVGFTYNPKTLAVHPLVYFNFYPEEAATRFPTEQQAAVRRNTEQDAARQIIMLKRLVDERGLRARLRTASLLTGQRYISFEFDPTAPKARVDWTRNPLELPVAPGEIEDLETKLESILGKVDRMPITQIGERTSTALNTLNGTLSQADVLLRHVDTSALPRVNKALGDVDRALDNANATLLGKDAPSQEALREALQELANTARSLRALTDYLQRHPEALIRGRVREHRSAGGQQ